VARLVVFDMDGVLADIGSSWVHVHRHFGVNNDHSLYAYLRGEIDDLEFIRRDIELWMTKEPGVDAARIRDILSDVPLMPGAQECVRGLKARGFRTAIVSAGIDLLADRIASELAIDEHLANGFGVDEAGRLSGRGILRVRLMDKGDAVAAVGRKLGASRNDIVSVGNSRYDLSMFERSRLGIAFCPEDEQVRSGAGAVVEEKDLSKVLEVIDSRVPR